MRFHERRVLLRTNTLMLREDTLQLLGVITFAVEFPTAIALVQIAARKDEPAVFADTV